MSHMNFAKIVNDQKFVKFDDFFFDKFQFREFDIFFRIFREFAVVKNQQKCLIRIFHEFSKIKR